MQLVTSNLNFSSLSVGEVFVFAVAADVIVYLTYFHPQSTLGMLLFLLKIKPNECHSYDLDIDTGINRLIPSDQHRKPRG